MDINKIKNPKFLRGLNNKQLEALARDIRQFLIENISETGGHFSSNMGIVDLTIMIHKNFNAPYDKIIFDVGHQCYTHKILTGRADKFDTLRKYKGLSGFQKRSESVYDCYEAGHSSTSISAGVGFAISRNLNNEHYHIVVVIGDGSISNGLSYEAMNYLGGLNIPIIVILNDNEMSISKNVGALHNTLDKIRVDCGYNKIKTRTKRLLDLTRLGSFIKKKIRNFKGSIKKIYLQEGYIFEEMGFKYYGPINGHDYREMDLYLNIAKKEKGPVLLHVITEKGYGYKYAHNDQNGKWHGVPRFDIESGNFLIEKTDLITWSEVISNILINLTNKNKHLVVITPAMGVGSKLLTYAKKFPNNFFDVGIMEEHALVMANAMSLNNVIPFVSIYSTFLQRGYDAVIHDIARMNSHVIIGVDRAGLVDGDGETHHGVFDVAFLSHIPNLIIMSPKDSDEAYDMLYTATKINKPFAIRYSKRKINYNDHYRPKLLNNFNWEIIEGNDGYLVAYGDYYNKVLNIRDELSRKGYDFGVVNARFIKPLDKNCLEKIFMSEKIYIIEEVVKKGSLGSMILEYANEIKIQTTIHLFSIDDCFVTQGDYDSLINELELDDKTIINKILKDINDK